MTIQELETMLTTITKERMGEVLTMKMPEDKTKQLSDNISNITQRLDKFEEKVKQEEIKAIEGQSEKAMDDYFMGLLG